MGTPHRLSVIAHSRQIQFCALRHYPDASFSLLTASILSFRCFNRLWANKKPCYHRGKQGLEILWRLYYLLASGLSNLGS